MEKTSKGQVIEGKYRVLNTDFISFATQQAGYRVNSEPIKIDYKTVEDVK